VFRQLRAMLPRRMETVKVRRDALYKLLHFFPFSGRPWAGTGVNRSGRHFTRNFKEAT